MAVESDFAARQLRSYGMQEEKMIVTGKPSFDRVFLAQSPDRIAAHRQILGLSDHSRVVLCAVPQLGEHHILPWAEHWKETEELFRSLAQLPDAVVLLSLHPKSDIAAYAPLARRFSLTIASQRIFELLPLCTAFVASHSSTILLALTLGKPVVLLDYYKMGNTMFDHEPGITVLRDRSALVPALQCILSRSGPVGAEDGQVGRGCYWARLDGLCTERVAHEIRALLGP